MLEPAALAAAEAGSTVENIRLEIAAASAAASQARVELVRLREALAEDQFVLNFQPLISLKGDETEHYEVLVRMKAPTGEIVAPDTFMPIAEEHGLLGDIDRWVIGRTISLLGERQKAGKTTTLFAKVSPIPLAEGDQHNDIGPQHKAHGVPGEHLVLQLPES
jgi:EAL domain-containing protein (putative c-di-GMP-specific phosphodiesterase class I)